MGDREGDGERGGDSCEIDDDDDDDVDDDDESNTSVSARRAVKSCVHLPHLFDLFFEFLIKSQKGGSRSLPDTRFLSLAAVCVERI